MNGKEAVLAFLKANESKEELPSLFAETEEADREAILSVAMELYRKVTTSESTSARSQCRVIDLLVPNVWNDDMYRFSRLSLH